MAYEIQELPRPYIDGETYRIVDPDKFGFTEFDVVYNHYFNRKDAEADLVVIKRDEDIHDSFDAWIHAKADEHGVHRSEIAKQLDVHQFMR